MPHQVSKEFLRPPIWDPVPPWLIFWDPVPPWLDLDEGRLRQFADLEIQFKIKELQIRQEKLEEFRKIIG